MIDRVGAWRTGHRKRVVTCACMIRRLVLVPVALLTLAAMGDASAAVGDDFDGTYVCVTDRTAGLQNAKEEGAERFAGAIKPRPERANFFVVVRKIEAGARFPDAHDGWDKHDATWCFSESAMKNLQSQWERGGADSFGRDTSLAPSVDEFQRECLATRQARIRIGGIPESYYATGGNVATGDNIFLGYFGQRFWFSGEGIFHWDYMEAGGFYVAEGRCSFVR